jgi:hypothetical protein
VDDIPSLSLKLLSKCQHLIGALWSKMSCTLGEKHRNFLLDLFPILARIVEPFQIPLNLSNHQGISADGGAIQRT